MIEEQMMDVMVDLKIWVSHGLKRMVLQQVPHIHILLKDKSAKFQLEIINHQDIKL